MNLVKAKTYGPIYLNETFTPRPHSSLHSRNRLFLKEAQKTSKDLKYKYPGYTINGQVRVRESSGDENIPINNGNDLRNTK